MSETLLYLDNAASSHPKPVTVREAMCAALEAGANPGRSGHRLALDAARTIGDVRELAAKLINAGDSSEVVFTHNATHALNMALKGYLNPGDHVVTTSMEHNSVLRPLHALAAQGVAVTMVRGDLDGWVDPAKLRDAITPATRLVVVNHASNVCGTLVDAAAVGEICRKCGVAFLLDASQTLGALPVDVRALGVSMLAAPGHKGLLGPQGTGLLYVNPAVELTPIIQGGTGFSSESPEMPNEMPERLEGGTQNTPGIAGLGAGIEYLLTRTVKSVRQAEEEALAALLAALAAIPEVRVYGPCDPRRMVGVVSFNLEGRDGAHVGYVLDEIFNIAVRVGLHCAPEAHKTLGTFPVGTVRASLGPFNVPADADRLASALRTIISL